MSNNTVTYGAYLIYANGEFEAERTTRSSAKATVAKIRRMGMSPTVKRHAWDGRGFHWNAECGTKQLTVRPQPLAQAPAASTASEVAQATQWREVRRETWPDDSPTTLSFAVRVF